MPEKANECSVLVADHLKQRGWHIATCPSCGNGIYTKQPPGKDVKCGRHQCAHNPVHFLTLPKRKRPISVHDVYKRLRDFFARHQVVEASALPLGRLEGVTDLVVAGVQRYDDVLHGHVEATRESCFVAQPCVRMQFLPAVGETEGVSTAFVNVCTESSIATPEEHVSAIDWWLDAISKLGLHMNDVMLVSRTKEQNWGTGVFVSFDVFFMYGGLELGDASYADIPRAAGSALAISDIGFGLERIAWALNKTTSYYDLLRPFTSATEMRINDLCRTLTLMALSGIKPGPKGAGLQFRRLAKLLYESGQHDIWFGLVSYYCTFWSPFVGEHGEHAETVIRLEVDRFRNLDLQRQHKLPPPREETTEEYLSRMVYSNGVDPSRLRAKTP